MKESTTVIRRTRNRALTCQTILNAVDTILASEGLDGLGINRVSELAGVSKVLIYRYFGGIDGLLTRYIEQKQFFPHRAAEDGRSLTPDKNSSYLSCWNLLSTFPFVRQQPQAVELMKCLVKDDDELAHVAGQAIEEQLTHFTEHLHVQGATDAQAVRAVLVGAMTYMTLLSKLGRPIAGIDLSTERNWHRVETAIAAIFEGLYAVQASKTDPFTLENTPLAA